MGDQARFAQACRRPLDPGPVTAVQHHGGAVLGKPLRQGKADALA